MAGIAANPPSPEGWQQAKPLIEQLYVQEDRPLKEVRAYLAEHRSFLATERMFKQRLKEWGFDRKKVKAAEWRYMLTVTQQRRRAGKETAFRVNGKIIVWSNIRKHLKRKKKSEDEFLAAGSEIETVDDVLCYTPPSSPRLLPTQAIPLPPPTPAHQSTGPPSRIIPLPSDHYAACSSKSASAIPINPNSLPHPAITTPLSSAAPSRNPKVPALVRPDRPMSRLSLHEGSALTVAQIYNTLFRPLSSNQSPHPLDRPVGLKMTLMMSGMSYKSGRSLATGALRAQLDDWLQTDDSLPGSNQSSPTDDMARTRPAESPAEDKLAAVWVTHYFLACVCEWQNDVGGAQEGIERASQVFRSMLIRFNPYLLTGLTLISSILYFHGMVELLKRFLQQSCDTIEDLFSHHHPIFVPYRYMLECVTRVDTETPVGNEALRRAWTQFQLTWRSIHPNTLVTRYYYGCSLLDSGRPAEAEEELRGCFELASQSLGECHILTVWSLATLSRVLSSTDERRSVDALHCLESAIERCRKVMHPEHPYYLELHRYLAGLQRKLNKPEQAEFAYRLVLKGRIKVLGSDAETTRASVIDLADYLMANDKAQEANELRNRHLNPGSYRPK